MTRFRPAARLIPACGLTFALMLPAAGSASPSANLGSFVQHDKGGGKGQGKDKQKHEKQRDKDAKHQRKANKQKKNEHRHRADVQRHRGRDRFDAQQRFERQQRRERERQRQVQRQRQLERQRQLDRRRSFERQRQLERQREWEWNEAARRNRARSRSAWPRSGNLADRPGRGIVHVQGEVTAEGLRCTAVRGDDGRLYTLVGGEARGLRPGDDVWISGRVVNGAGCRQGTTLEIHQLRDLGRDGRWSDDRRRDDDWDDDDWDDDDWDDRDGWEERERRDRLGRIFGGDRDRWDERSRGELVDLRGRIAAAGGCPTLRGDDGRTYELAGDLRGFGRGDSVRLVGVMEGGSRCGVGPSVRIGQIDRR